MMNFEKKNTLMILIAGKARSGKGEVAKIFEEELKKEGKKVIISPYTKYLKKYIYEITGEYRDDDNKPRDLLQKLSSELIKKELNNQNFFINRQIEDLSFYSYFMDVTHSGNQLKISCNFIFYVIESIFFINTFPYIKRRVWRNKSEFY